MKKKIATLALLIISLSVYSQCIEQDKIGYGGDWSNYHYTYFCPTYEFSYGGDTSKQWNVLNNHIDINQVGKVIFPIKESVEAEILKFSGQAFFSKVKFLSVQIVYPDSIEKFSGRIPFCELDSCRAKYFFYYKFSPVENANYNIGIAANEKGEIINNFNFPCKKDYKIVDTTLNICKVLEIANQYKDKIESIEKVRFDYDKQVKRFYWIVTEEIKNEKEGINNYKELFIDASDSSKVEIKESSVMIMF